MEAPIAVEAGIVVLIAFVSTDVVEQDPGVDGADVHVPVEADAIVELVVVQQRPQGFGQVVLDLGVEAADVDVAPETEISLLRLAEIPQLLVQRGEEAGAGRGQEGSGTGQVPAAHRLAVVDQGGKLELLGELPEELRIL